MSESKTLEQPAKEHADEWKVGPGALDLLVIVLLVFPASFQSRRYGVAGGV